jgi:hypothetical protein
MIRSFILLALAAGWAQSATVLVPGGSWSTFSIDMDNDGQIDLRGTNIHFGYVEGTFYSDRLNTAITGPVSIFKERGFYVDPSTPEAAGLNGTYTVTSLLRSNNNMTDAGYGYFTFYNNQPQKSYVSLWVGNAGNSGDPITLLAVHVDARDYIANNSNPIKFHYGVYGPLTDASGNNTVTVDFANLTAIPEPSALSLLAMGIGGVIALRRVNRRADSV